MVQIDNALLKQSVDPNVVPKITLNDGSKIPSIGYGTFGSDHVSAEEVAKAMQIAILLGYRQLDCARAYRNEAEIGKALEEMLKSGVVRREDMHITSKLWNDRHKERDVLVSCAESLRDLRLEYLDLYLVHWPFPNSHTPGCAIDARDPHARPFFEDEFMMVWRQMENLVDMGLVRSIGVSNMTRAKLEAVLPAMRIKPVVNEIEQHPHLQQKELFSYLHEKNIAIIGHTPLGGPNRPERDRTPDDTNVLADPVMVKIAQKHHVHPATIAIKWAVQRGTIPVPFSASPKHILSNLRCTIEDPLSEEEMREIAEIDQNNRLIKGHVLLWEGAPDWKALWDIHGQIDRTGWNDERVN